MKIKEGGVMDFQKEREAFEKLPAVAELIKTNNVWWSDVHGDYFGSDHELDCWIDGAWAVWQAKAQAVPEGFVLMPIKPTKTMVMAVVKEHEGDAFLPYSLYDAYVKQAMIEAQEPANE